LTTPVLVADVLIGLTYVATGVGLLIGKRLFSYLGAILPPTGAVLGTYIYIIEEQFNLAQTSVAVAIDVIVVLCCGFLILQKKSQPIQQ